ncbi:hypothetical protein FBT96_00185 [Rhodobacter capsulatus]|uniref:Uncharacterized protein n=1 Tax=Rhodobacter capsulatus TaxID=1061 RepID=A0A4U1K320_RHOCA|nr:ABZJ_00895 family protein [Rhodobacter capsulatus]TKD26535.1 hypothetical protein FBT96_00185 [Rhodobacter capsulatus]
MPILRYGLILILTGLVVSGLVLALERLAGVDLASVGIAAVPVFLTAMIEGQFFAKRSGRLPARAEALRFAALATAVNLMLLGPALVLISLGDPALLALLRGFDAVLWLVILGVVVLITFPASYLFYGQGARSQLRALARQKARQGGAQ